jgi:uncharacterized protein YraI
MKRAFRTFLASGILSLAAIAAAQAEPAITRSPVNLMSGAAGKGRVLMHIPANAEVDVGDCRRAWCEVSWQDTFGYARQSALDLGALAEGGAPVYRGPVYEPAPVYVYPPPVVYGGGIVIGPRPHAWWGWRRW